MWDPESLNAHSEDDDDGDVVQHVDGLGVRTRHGMMVIRMGKTRPDCVGVGSDDVKKCTALAMMNLISMIAALEW